MKKTLLLLMALTSVVLQAQIINIPDPIFKGLLLQADTDNTIAGLVKIDANDDGEIEQSEALSVYELNLPPATLAI